MKKLVVIALVAAAALSGCVVAPVGPGYYRSAPVVVGPAVVAAPPAVVVRPYPYAYPYYGYGRGYGGRWR